MVSLKQINPTVYNILSSTEWDIAAMLGFDQNGLKPIHYMPYNPSIHLTEYADAITTIKLHRQDWDFFLPQLEEEVDVTKCNITSCGNLALIVSTSKLHNPYIHSKALDVLNIILTSSTHINAFTADTTR